ncbi:MAG TPA: NAD-dependent epimerase/dehydratase family protein [Pseudonocardiaceae bacterium]|jgi:UDP-glucose 4-epimerase|nr:NAD-dependent epimerase/dehydratase family protein [Pseudonocardiaceae bacterium]
MRIVVTGGAGFIGSHLVDAFLARGDEVMVIDDLSHGRVEILSLDAVRLHQVSVTDVQAVTNLITTFTPEVICHLAAQISVRHSMADPAADAETNVIGTVNVLTAAAKVNARVVFASTGGAMYGNGVALPTPEDLPPGTEAPYGVSKHCAEQYLALFNKLHGSTHVALRLGNVYGPRQDPHGEAGVVAIFCGQAAHDDQPTIYGDGEQTRDYVFVGDIVDAFLAAIHYDGDGVFNVGTGIETSVLDLLEAVSAAVGRHIEPRFAPPRTGEVRRVALDSTRAADTLGWKATTTLRDGIRITYEALTPNTR